MSGYEYDRDRGFFCADCVHVAQIQDEGCGHEALTIAIMEPRGCSGCEYLREGKLFSVPESQRIVRALGNAPPAAGPWIPVGERLPEMGKPVLISDAQDGMRVSYAYSVRVGEVDWEDDRECSGLFHVTHWAELRGPK